MCDYSLAALRTRLAVVGEELVLYRFPTGTLGFTSPAELANCKYELHGWRPWVNAREVPCAVCIPPYARLTLRDIPGRLHRELGVGAVEEVVFIQMSDKPGRHRDGVRFANNQQVLLQHLREGQRAETLSISLPESTENLLDRESMATDIP